MVVITNAQCKVLLVACDSYGVNAMLISFNVLILFAARELQISLNLSSGQAAKEEHILQVIGVMDIVIQNCV